MKYAITLILYVIFGVQMNLSAVEFEALSERHDAHPETVALLKDEAIREALFHLSLYKAFCRLRSDEGTSIAAEFQELFALNAYVPDDVTRGEALTALQYVDTYTQYFGETPVQITFNVKEDQVSAKYLANNDTYEVSVPFLKKMSHKVVNGKVVKEEQSYWMKALISVDADLRAKILGISTFVPSTGADFLIGLHSSLGVGANVLNTASLAQAPDPSNFAVDMGVRARYIFNPLSPAHITQRKNIRLYLGVDVGFTNFSTSVDELSVDSIYRQDLYMGAGSGQTLSGWVRTSATDVHERWQFMHVTGVVGLNVQLYQKAQRKVLLNVGVAYDVPFMVSYSQSATCYEEWLIEPGQFSASGNGIDHTAGGSGIVLQRDDNVFQCNTTEWSKDGTETLRPQFMFDINPTFQFKPGTGKSRFEAGIQARVPMNHWLGEGKAATDVFTRMENSMLKEYTDRWNFIWFGINFAMLF